MKDKQRQPDSDNQKNKRKPKVEPFDPFLPRPTRFRAWDQFGEMFDEKVTDDDF